MVRVANPSHGKKNVSLLQNVYIGLLFNESSGRGVKLTSHLYLVRRLRVGGVERGYDFFPLH